MSPFKKLVSETLGPIDENLKSDLIKSLSKTKTLVLGTEAHERLEEFTTHLIVLLDSLILPYVNVGQVQMTSPAGANQIKPDDLDSDA